MDARFEKINHFPILSILRLLLGLGQMIVPNLQRATMRFVCLLFGTLS